MAKVSSGQTMRSAERLLAVLKAFRKDAAVRSLTEISKELELSPTTVKRLLQTLENSGFVCMDATGSHYRLDHELIRLASVALSGSSLVQLASSSMDALNQHLNESIQLTIRDRTDLIVIDSRQSRHLLQAFHSVGHRYSALRGSAAGQVLLAHLTEDELNQLLPQDSAEWAELPSGHPVDHSAFFESLAAAKTNGYAINDGGTDTNIWAVAAPITDKHKDVAAAINVPVPAARAKSKERRNELIQAVTKAAEDISNAAIFAS